MSADTMSVKIQGFGSTCYASMSTLLAVQLAVMVSYYSLLLQTTLTEKDLISLIAEATKQAGIDEADATRKAAWGSLIGGAGGAVSIVGGGIAEIYSLNKSATAANIAGNLGESITTVKNQGGAGLVLGAGDRITTGHDTLIRDLTSHDFNKSNFSGNMTVDVSRNGAAAAQTPISIEEVAGSLSPQERSRLMDTLKNQKTRANTEAQQYNTSAQTTGGFTQAASQLCQTAGQGFGNLLAAESQEKKGADSAASTSGQQNIETLRSGVDGINTKAAQDASDQAKALLNALSATIMASSKS